MISPVLSKFFKIELHKDGSIKYKYIGSFQEQQLYFEDIFNMIFDYLKS